MASLTPLNRMCKGCHNVERFEEIQKQPSLTLEKINQLPEPTNHLNEQNEGLRADIIGLKDLQHSSSFQSITASSTQEDEDGEAAVPQGASEGDQWPTMQSSHGPPALSSASPVPTEKGTPAAQRKVEKTPASGCN